MSDGGVVAFRRKEEIVLLRRAIATGTLAFLLACLLAGCGDDEPPDSPKAREGGSPTGESGEQETQAARQELAGETGINAETTAEDTSGILRCSEEEKKEREDLRLGDFEPPEDVPAYEIVEENPVERYGAKTTRLLVDTRSRSEEDYALITRDIKSRYAALDAVSVEFTDTTGTLSENGRALIFNTPCGSDYIGYIHHPPNNEGYQLIAAKD